MPHDVNEPSQEIRNLCACPVDWIGISGFGDECPDALVLLHYEWVRAIARVSVSGEELKLVESVLFDNDLYEAPDDATRRNLEDRRPDAEALYLSEIGRLGRLHFLRPSEHGKHYSIAGPKKATKNVSYFYRDWKSDTLANLFWSWFSDVMSVNEVPPREGPIDFLFDVNRLYDSFRAGRNFRIALDTCSAIGEQNGDQYQHLAIDLDLEACVAHGYPVSAAEADAIMRTCPVRPIKSREY